MSNINRVFISGRLTRDPEVRSTSGGMTVMGLGVAVNDRRRNAQTGQWEEQTNFIDCTMFGNRAEALSHMLSKGALVFIEGHLRWSQWEGKDGQKRSKIEVVVDEIEMPSRPQGEGGQYAAQQGYAQNYGQPQGSFAPAPSYEHSYVPPQPEYAPQPAPSYGAPTAQMPVEQVYDDEIPF